MGSVRRVSGKERTFDHLPPRRFLEKLPLRYHCLRTWAFSYGDFDHDVINAQKLKEGEEEQQVRNPGRVEARREDGPKAGISFGASTALIGK